MACLLGMPLCQPLLGIGSFLGGNVAGYFAVKVDARRAFLARFEVIVIVGVDLERKADFLGGDCAAKRS